MTFEELKNAVVDLNNQIEADMARLLVLATELVKECEKRGHPNRDWAEYKPGFISAQPPFVICTDCKKQWDSWATEWSMGKPAVDRDTLYRSRWKVRVPACHGEESR